MRSNFRRSALLGLIPVILGHVVLLGGCGGTDAVDHTTGQAPPKDQMEGLQRIRQANIKHDQEAPKNRKSVATKR